MELYRKLAALRCFTREDMVRLTGSENAARWQIKKYLEKGYIERIRRDLYGVISLETSQAIPNRFQIASSVAADSMVTHHSAFEYYGYANQVFYDVYFSTAARVRSFTYDGIRYIPVQWKGDYETTETSAGVRVTSPERTVIDSISDFEKIGGLEELLRCLALVPSLDPDKLLFALEKHQKSQLYQKAACILESFREDLGLPDSFFSECRKKASNSKTYLIPEHDGFVLHEQWKLYAPKDLNDITNKGAADHDGV